MKKNFKIISVLSITTLATALSLAFVARANKAPFVAAEGAKNKIVETINVSNSLVDVLGDDDYSLFEVIYTLPSGYDFTLDLKIFSDKDMTDPEIFDGGVDSLFTVYGTHSIGYTGTLNAENLAGYDSITFSGRMVNDTDYDRPYEAVFAPSDSLNPEVEGHYDFIINDGIYNADSHCMLKVTEITLTYYC